MASGVIKRPRLYRNLKEGDEASERHATWLELFFDLVFVVAIAQVAHVLEEDLSVRGLLIFLALFVLVWWQWIDFSYYADQFETDDLRSQIVTFTVMLGVIVMALAIPKVTHGGSIFFACAYAALRVIIVALYAWAWRHVPESRELTSRYTISFAIALVLWLISIFTPEPVRFYLWGAALFIEIFNGPATYATIKQVPRQASHMDERFGLFLIIVLGEAVIAVSGGIVDAKWNAFSLVVAVAGFIIAALFWWLYFSHSDATVIHRALRSNRTGLLLSYLYGYSHFFVFAGITAAGVGIESAIKSAPNATFDFSAQTVLGISILLCLLGMTVLQWATPQSLSNKILAVRIAACVFCASVIYLRENLSPFGTVLAFLIIIGSVVAAEALLNNSMTNFDAGQDTAKSNE